MPIGEIEHHPYLSLGRTLNSNKLILGTFPIYECTAPDSKLKKEQRDKNNSFQFFYGSGSSKFWQLYQKYLDVEVKLAPTDLRKSLSSKGISVSDLVKKCERKGYSPADSDLRNIEWNSGQIIGYFESGVTHVLCTSKNVLALLKAKILNNYSVNSIKSQDYQRKFLEHINGNITDVVNPIILVFEKGNQTIIAIAIPSPGSIQRKLKTFGKGNNPTKEYADRYLATAFNWLMQRM